MNERLYHSLYHDFKPSYSWQEGNIEKRNWLFYAFHRYIFSFKILHLNCIFLCFLMRNHFVYHMHHIHKIFISKEGIETYLPFHTFLTKILLELCFPSNTTSFWHILPSYVVGACKCIQFLYRSFIPNVSIFKNIWGDKMQRFMKFSASTVPETLWGHARKIEY